MQTVPRTCFNSISIYLQWARAVRPPTAPGSRCCSVTDPAADASVPTKASSRGVTLLTTHNQLCNSFCVLLLFCIVCFEHVGRALKKHTVLAPPHICLLPQLSKCLGQFAERSVYVILDSLCTKAKPLDLLLKRAIFYLIFYVFYDYGQSESNCLYH